MSKNTQKLKQILTKPISTSNPYVKNYSSDGAEDGF